MSNLIGVCQQPFVAKYDTANQHLQKPAFTIAEKVKRLAPWVLLGIAYITLLTLSIINSPLVPIGCIVAGVIATAFLIHYGLRRIIKSQILPSTNVSDSCLAERFSIDDELQKTNQISLTKHTVITPDGIHLGSLLLKILPTAMESAKAATEEDHNIPTIVCFNTNGGMAGNFDFPVVNILQAAARNNKALNVVFFDYRGVGMSRDRLWSLFERTEDLILDGASIVQWVRDGLHTAPENIHFYGRSFGGAIAANTQALDDSLTGCHFNDRSFTSLDNAIKDWCGFLGWPFSWLVKKYGYALDASQPMRHLNGKKFIISHKNDLVMQDRARFKQQQEPTATFLELEGNVERFGNDGHKPPLDFYPEACDAISTAIFGSC